MKSVRNAFLFSAIALFLTIGSSLRAQNAQADIDAMKDLMTEYNVLASEAQALAQQVETFANNGNMNQLMNRMGGLSRSVSEINLIKMEGARLVIPDANIMSEIRLLFSEIDGDAALWASSGRANIEAVGGIAAALRERLNDHKGHAHEIRVALCCVML